LANSGFTLRDCTFNDNSASYGGSLFFGSDHVGIGLQRVVVRTSTADYGGGIYFDTFSTELSLIETVLEGNMALVQGGAVYTTADDMLMRGCCVLNNVAATGGGVYYPSDILTNHVNISFCLFDGNSASGLYGGVYVELASSVSIDSSNFTGNKASFGSAVGAKKILDADIQHCFFVENSARNSGGALYLEDNNLIFVTDSLFDGNTARAGSGSAVWLSSSSEVTIQGNQFVRNSAINGGGAVFWLVSSDMSVPVGLESTQSNALSGNYYEKNQAMYGNNVSTDVFSLILSDENNYKVTDYASPVPPIEVDIVDFYGQIVVIESTGVAVASVLTTATCFQSTNGYVTGGFVESIQAGVFNFSTLNVYCDPGYSMSVNVTSPYYDVKSTYFTLSFRSCVRGEYYEDSVCKPCEVGTYSLTDPSTKELSELSNSAVCKPCPSGAKNCHGDTIELKKGYWRISDNTTTLLACPYGEQGCRGGAGSGDALCGDGYEGE
jgi:predicted outer membrane repeat protein